LRQARSPPWQSNVYSLNVVGYISRVVPASGKFALVGSQLDTGNNTYSNLFQTLPPGTKVLKWTGGGFSTATRFAASATGWSPATNNANTFNPGEAVFIQTALTNPVPITNIIAGNVPSLAATGGTNPVYSVTFTNSWVHTGFSMLSDPEPEASDATTMGLTAAITPATVTQNPKNQLLIWNEATQGYGTFSRVTFTGSGWSPSLPSLQVGQGFFLNTTNTGSWVHTFNVN